MKRHWILGAAVSVALAGYALAPAVAQTRAVPDSRDQVLLSFSPVVKRAAPAVVNIYTKRVVRQQVGSALLNDPLFRQFFGDRVPQGLSRERVQNSLGSGVILQADGLIVTNNHVIEGADEITVVMSDRREFAAQVVRRDERTDLAVLKVDTGAERLPVLELRDSDSVEVGDLVLAIGNPFGVGQTVTSGIVSAVARTNTGISDYSFFIQTDAAINPGNSGGALVGMDGRLLGINTAIFSRSGGSIGIGFAIPANMVRTVLQGGANPNTRVVRAWFGAGTQPVTAELASSLGLARPGGALITDLYPGGPAERAGLRSGDVVTAIDGRPVEDPEALRYRIATLPIGSTARLQVQRRGAVTDASLTAVAPPEVPARETTQLRGNHPMAGATVANLSPALADELGLPVTARGVIVTDVPRGSNAARLRLQPGDIVVDINRQEIDSVRGLRTALEAGGQRWRISIRRGTETLTTVITP